MLELELVVLELELELELDEWGSEVVTEMDG